MLEFRQDFFGLTESQRKSKPQPILMLPDGAGKVSQLS